MEEQRAKEEEEEWDDTPKEEGAWGEAAHQIRSLREMQTTPEISSLGTTLMDGLAEYCESYSQHKGLMVNTKSELKIFDQVLAISWGLMALDPHHTRFASLLNNMLVLEGKVLGVADQDDKPLLRLHRLLPIPPGGGQQERAEWLVKQALDGGHSTTLPPFLFIVEAAHLYSSTEPGTAGIDRTAWLAGVLQGDVTAPRWPQAGLSHRHLLALYRTRQRWGHVFLEFDLTCLVRKALLSFCWSHDGDALLDDDWCGECVEILLLLVAGCPDGQLQEVLGQLPPKLRGLFKRKEQEDKLIDEDNAEAEETMDTDPPSAGVYSVNILQPDQLPAYDYGQSSPKRKQPEGEKETKDSSKKEGQIKKKAKAEAEAEAEAGAGAEATKCQDESSTLIQAQDLLVKALTPGRQPTEQGYPHLTILQQRTLTVVVDQRKNVLLVERTGGGKSATYFIATKLIRAQNKNAGPTIVLSPLLALIKDQVRSAEKFGLRADTCNSEDSDVKRNQTFAALRRNLIDILFLTPEKLVYSQELQNRVTQFRINYQPQDYDAWNFVPLLVLDEAHCISEWGHDFRPAYHAGLLELKDTHPWFKNSIKLATSATINDRAEAEVLSLHPPPYDWVNERGSLYRTNLAIRVIQGATTSHTKQQWLLQLLKDSPQANVLAFAFSIPETEATARYLCRNGVQALAYHSKVENRTEIENAFLSGRTKVVVSTTALGMGFDKRDIDIVVHLYTPVSPLQYYQEIGRAGRDPNIKARAFLLPTKPRVDQRSPAEAWRRLFLLLSSSSVPVSEEEVVHALQQNNIGPREAKEAVALAVKQRYIDVSHGVRLTAKGLEKKQGGAEDKRALELRTMERDLMDGLSRPSSCLWKTLLLNLRENLAPGWRCDHCTHCCPASSAPEHPADPDADNKIAYRATTPQGIVVYGLGRNSDQVSLDSYRVHAIIAAFEGGVTIDPPNWWLTYVPSSSDNDKNKKNWKDLAEALRYASFEYVTSVDTAGSMTASNSQPVRADVIAKKFPHRAFNLPAIPSYGNVIIYDDAMKSGMTIDAVAEPLLRMGKRVIGIVDRIYTCDGRDPEALEIPN